LRQAYDYWQDQPGILRTKPSGEGRVVRPPTRATNDKNIESTRRRSFNNRLHFTVRSEISPLVSSGSQWFLARKAKPIQIR